MKRIVMMKSLDNMPATIEFRLNWEHNGIRHTDCRHAQRVNFWRDIRRAAGMTMTEASGRHAYRRVLRSSRMARISGPCFSGASTWPHPFDT